MFAINKKEFAATQEIDDMISISTSDSQNIEKKRSLYVHLPNMIKTINLSNIDQCLSRLKNKKNIIKYKWCAYELMRIRNLLLITFSSSQKQTLISENTVIYHHNCWIYQILVQIMF